MPRVTKDPTERRQEILDTALKLFWEKGYEKTSMTEIAQAMQVAQGLCYRYFPSKEALFQTAVDQYAQRQVDQIASVLRKPGLTLVQVVEQMPTFLETEAEDSAIAKLCHGPESEKLHGPLSMAICAKLQPLVQQLLEKANERGEVQIADTETAASFCVYGQLGILWNQTLSGEERVRRVKAFLIHLLTIF